MIWTHKIAPSVTLDDVKLCELCDALNHRGNAECFTCGWRGDFGRDAATIALAWNRLYSQFEDVRFEHVTGQKRTTLKELGIEEMPGKTQQACASVKQWWQTLRVRTAQKQRSQKDVKTR